MIRGQILRSKEVRAIKSQLMEQWGWAPEKNYVWIETGRGRLYIVNRELGDLDFEKLKVEHPGLYFCTKQKDALRLSLDGSQIVGPHDVNIVNEIN